MIWPLFTSHSQKYFDLMTPTNTASQRNFYIELLIHDLTVWRGSSEGSYMAEPSTDRHNLSAGWFRRTVMQASNVNTPLKDGKEGLT